MAVGVCINFDNEGWEKDEHPELVHTDVAASLLTLVGAEAVEQVAQGRDVETITDQDELPVDGDDGQAGTKDGGKRVVSNTDTAAGSWSVI